MENEIVSYYLFSLKVEL
jgi:hypothetical protein